MDLSVRIFLRNAIAAVFMLFPAFIRWFPTATRVVDGPWSLPERCRMTYTNNRSCGSMRCF